MTRLVRPHALILVLLIVFCTLATVNSLATPLFEAPDELDHYQFARYLSTTWSLPVLRTPPASSIAHQEAGQAPLYYALAALSTSWLGDRESRFAMRPNPHGGAGGPDEVNKNLWLHSDAEQFPYQGDFLAAHLIRLLSALLGAGTVLFTYLTARTLWPDSTWLSYAGAAMVAFNPQFIFISGAISNDVIAALFAAASLWALCNLLKKPCGARQFLVVGIAVGLGLLTKVSFAAMFPLSLMTGIVVCRRNAHPSLAKAIACLTVPPMVIAGWWYARNLVLYGEPFATSISAIVAGGGDVHPALGELLADAEGLRKSFWAVFGAFNIIVNPILYAFYDVIVVLGTIGLLIAAYQHRDKLRLVSAHSLLLVWVVIVVAALVRWRFQVLGFQGRLLFPALPAIALLLAYGLLTLIPSRWWRAGSLMLSCSLLASAIAAPVVYISPAYRPPSPIPLTTVASIARPIDAVFGRELELVGYEVKAQVAEAGARIPIILYWRAVAPMSRDYSVFIHLLAPDGRILGQVDTYPASTMFPTSKWPTGDIFAGKYFLPVSSGVQNVPYVELSAGIYQAGSGTRSAAQDTSGRALGGTIRLLKLSYHDPIALSVSKTATLAIFGDSVALADFHVNSSAVKRGDKLTGKVNWRSLKPMKVSYTVFMHLVREGKLAAQLDSPPLDGTYPTTQWAPGEVVEDSFSMSIDRAVELGDYQLMVGLYDPTTIKRLPTGRDTYFVADIIRVVE